MKKTILIISALTLSSVACKVRKGSVEESELAADGRGQSTSFTQISLSAPIDPESKKKVYFHNPRIASQLYWDLKTKKLPLTDIYMPVFSKAELDEKTTEYEKQPIGSGNDSALIVDVYVDDGWVQDTKVGRIIIPVRVLASMKSGTKVPVMINKVDNKTAKFEVTVTKK